MNILTGNLFYNSYFKGNLVEPIFLHVYLLGAFRSGNLFSKNAVSYVPLEITVVNKIASENILAGI
jgi:hypothetical protein